MIDNLLVSCLQKVFVLDWHGIHGAPHWSRVRQIGLRLAPHTGANLRVVELFAFLHDACRRNDGHDPHHGPRAALLAERMNATVLRLSEPELGLLVVACQGHSDGQTHEDVTVSTCWDADRLDLGRVGIRPDPRRLCTAAARDPALIQWAFSRSVANAG